MSLKFHDGFDWLPAGASLSTLNALMQARGYYLRGSGPIGTLFGASLVTGRFGYGQRLHMSFGTGSGEWLANVKAINGQNSAGGFVSAGWNIGGVSTGFPFLGVYDLVNDQVLCCVSAAPNGTVAAYRGVPLFGGVWLGQSDTNTYNDGADIDVEVFFKVHGTTGEIEVRINTVSVLHLINVNTQPGGNAYFDGVCWGSSSSSLKQVEYYIDDFRYYDTAGSINNTWLGTCRVQTCLTASAGATTDFTRSNTGLANWQNAKNQNVDDSLYVFDPTVGDYDLYGIQPLVNSPTVFGVQVTSFVRQDDATQRTFKNRVSSSATLADGAAFFTSQTYTADSDMFELNPHTALTFTGAQVNALQIGPYVYA